ncbi:MAG: hypothetical protein HPY74_04215 [Firmicutes bacterium]|nr:hypothetical protein [Bacillota bacterium]
MDRKTRQQKQEATNVKSSEDVVIEKNGKLNNFMFGFLAFIVAIVIMSGILVGAFYFVVHNNIYGIGEKYRKEIQNMPLLKWALPKPPDPDDPEYLTDAEIRNKYKKIKEERDKLLKELEDANRLISELEIYKEGYEKVVLEREKEESKLMEEKRKIEEDRAELQKLAAKGDKEGFKKYFETIDRDTAEEIYKEILLEEKSDMDMKGFIQIYENMDESSAARILNEMGEQRIEIIVKILLGMKKENASAILGEMEPGFASKITEKMAESFIKTE